jgi:hypothetical protein
VRERRATGEGCAHTWNITSHRSRFACADCAQPAVSTSCWVVADGMFRTDRARRMDVTHACMLLTG